MNMSLSNIINICTFIFVITSLSINAQFAPNQMPFQPGQGMPKLSDEDLKALEEVDKILSNMNPEEMDEFLKFVEEIEKGIESGEININDLLPPGMQVPQQPQKPQPAQPAPEEKKPTEAPAAQPTCAVEKQVALRNKNAAEAMINTLLNHIAGLRVKAASYRKTADRLAPWNERLDTLVYYLHVIIQKHHIEQLVCDKELINLHDVLKELSDALKKYEPLVATPEFGLEPLEATTKKRSQDALQTILRSFDKAFKQDVIKDLEKLLAKYEPELLKKRKEMEAQEERAKKESEAMKGWQPAHARIARESDYAARGGGFYDWFYNRDRRSPQPSRGYNPPSAPEYQGPSTSTKGPRQLPPLKPAQGGARGGEAGQGGGAGAPEAGAQAPSAGLPTRPGAKPGAGTAPQAPSYTPQTKEESRLERYISEVEDIFDQIQEAYLDKEYMLGNPSIVTYFSMPATTKQDADAAINVPLTEIVTALHTVAKKGGEIQAKLKKAPPQAQLALGGRFKQSMEESQKMLDPLYQALFGQLRLIHDNQPGRMSGDKIYLHMGYKNLGDTVRPDILASVEQPINYIDNFMTIYELIFKPAQAKARMELSQDLMKREQERAAAQETKARKRQAEQQKKQAAQAQVNPEE